MCPASHICIVHLRNAVEASVLHPILTIVEQAAKHQHAHEHQGEEQAKVLQITHGTTRPLLPSLRPRFKTLPKIQSTTINGAMLRIVNPHYRLKDGGLERHIFIMQYWQIIYPPKPRVFCVWFRFDFFLFKKDSYQWVVLKLKKQTRQASLSKN